MATVVLRRFTNPDTLKHNGDRYLIELLSPQRTFWGITVDEVFFLGGIEKKRVLEIFRPHLFFDDQQGHLKPVAESRPCVHVPFGVVNA